MRMDQPVGIKDSQTSRKAAWAPESIAPSGSDTVWVIGSILMQTCHELSSSLMLSHAELLVVCMMRPKHCLAVRDQFKQYGCCYRRACERRLKILVFVVSDIC